MAEVEKGKSAPLPWVLLTGLLGIFAVGGPQATSTNTPNKKADDKKPDADPASFVLDSDRAGPDPLKPIADFHNSFDPAMKPDAQVLANLHGYKTEFLIATVPDPIDSSYGHLFDQTVDAIQRAVEKRDGYLLDRCWLPWEVDRKSKPKPGEAPKSIHDKEPGVLLFRHGKDKTRKVDKPGLCVVFLVGETQMSGIHKHAFHKALTLIEGAKQPESEPIRVIGPYFSGSQTSLQFLIGDWWKRSDYVLSPTYRFNVITGSASAIRKNEFFSYEANKENFPAWREGGMEFASTVIPTRTTLSALLHFLTRRDGAGTHEPVSSSIEMVPGKVAVLAEGNTGFGKSFANIRMDQVVTLRFPLHISRVKNEYNQAAKERDKKAGLNEDDPLAGASINDDQSQSEGVPSQGGSTTTALSGQVLSRILATISREQCRYVGIVASDTRDKLFLIRLIREHCPDVRVFVTDGDLLLTHPEYRYHMRGVIVGSTYPLIPRNQSWVKGVTRELSLLPSVGAQGYYNATLMHLGVEDQLLEYAPPLFALRGSGVPEGADTRPPIWISMVAPSGAIVPLHLYTQYEDKSNYVARNSVTQVVKDETISDRAALNYPGILLPVGVTLLVWWSFLVCRAWANPHARMFWKGGSLLQWQDLFYRNIILGSQVLLATPVLCVVVTDAEARHFSSIAANALVVLAGGCMFGLAFGMIKPVIHGSARSLFGGQRSAGDSGTQPTPAANSRAGRLNWLVLNLAVWLIVFGFAAFFPYRFWALGDAARRTLFFVRAVDLSTGLSPLTPLLFLSLAFSAWGFFQLKRTYISERAHVPTPYPDADAFRRIHKADAGIHDELGEESLTINHSGSMIVAGMVVLGFGFDVWLHSIPTVEGWAWDIVFFAGFACLFLLSITTLIRLFFLWRKVKDLLDAIAAQPMMRAFGQLPSKVTEIFGKYLFTKRPQLSHLQLPAHQLSLLVEAVESDPTAPNELKGMEKSAEEISRRLHEQLSMGARAGKSRRAEREVRQMLSQAAAKCISVVVEHGRSLKIDDAFGGGQGKGEKASDEPKLPEWLRLAESVAATQVVIYLSQYFVQLRNLVFAAMATASLLIMAATSYPFHPEKLLLIGLIAMSAISMGGVVYLLVEMNRDEVISRVTKSTPGKFSLDSGFLGSFITYVVPAAGVLAAQLTGSFRWLLEPIMRVMK